MRQGHKKQDTPFPGLSHADVNEFVRIVSPGIDILGVDLSGNFLGDDTVGRMLEAIGNCPRFTSLWLAHNSLGPAVVDNLQNHIMHNFRARVLPEDNPLLVTAKAMVALRKELDGLPAVALRQRAAAAGVDPKSIQKAVEEAEKAAAASEITGVVSDGKGPCHKLLTSMMVSLITHSQSMSNGSAHHDDRTDGATDKAFTSLANSVSQMPRHSPFGLRVLSLGNNWIGDAGVAKLTAIMREPHCPLISLHLPGNDISDAGAADLASVLALEKIELVNLNLAGNYITNVGAKKIADSLDLNRSLMTLALEHNPIVRAVDADAKRPELKTFRPDQFVVCAARKTSARSFVYTYNLVNQEQSDPEKHRLRIHCLCSDGKGDRRYSNR